MGNSRPEKNIELQAVGISSPSQLMTGYPSSSKEFEFDESHAPLALLGNFLSCRGT